MKVLLVKRGLWMILFPDTKGERLLAAVVSLVSDFEAKERENF